MNESDKLAVFHMLEVAEQGRPHEIAAQFTASWFLSGELTGDQIFLDLEVIRRRTLDLMLSPQEIWDGLLPGGPGGEPEYGTVKTKEWLEISTGHHLAQEILTAFAKDVSDNERAEAVGELFREYGWVTDAPGKEVAGDDHWAYRVKIWLLPEFWEDGKPYDLDLFGTVHHESPLNVAEEVIDWMDQIEANTGKSANEMIALITHPRSNLHWGLIYEQAHVILTLDRAQKHLNELSYDTDFMDEEFQGIQDNMAEAGLDFVNRVNRPRASS